MTLGNQNNFKTKKKKRKDMDLFFMSAEENGGFGERFLSGFIFSNVDACC